MSTTTCESRRRDKEVSDEEVSAPRVASGAERHRSGAPNMPLPGTVQKLCFVVQALGRSRPLQCHPARSRTTTRPSPTVMASVGQIAHLLVLIGSVIMGSGLIGLGEYARVAREAGISAAEVACTLREAQAARAAQIDMAAVARGDTEAVSRSLGEHQESKPLQGGRSAVTEAAASKERVS